MSNLSTVLQELSKLAPLLTVFANTPECKSMAQLIVGLLDGDIDTIQEVATAISNDPILQQKVIDFEKNLFASIQSLMNKL